MQRVYAYLSTLDVHCWVESHHLWEGIRYGYSPHWYNHLRPSSTFWDLLMKNLDWPQKVGSLFWTKTPLGAGYCSWKWAWATEARATTVPTTENRIVVVAKEWNDQRSLYPGGRHGDWWKHFFSMFGWLFTSLPAHPQLSYVVWTQGNEKVFWQW